MLSVALVALAPLAVGADPDLACRHDDPLLEWPAELRAGGESLRAFLDRRAAPGPAAQPWIWAERAWLRARLGDGAASLDGMEEALAALGEDPHRRRLLWLWGWAALAAGDGATAERRFLEAAALGPPAPCWLAAPLALALELQGQRDQALRWWQRARDDHPEIWADPLGLHWQTRDWPESLRERLQSLSAALPGRS